MPLGPDAQLKEVPEDEHHDVDVARHLLGGVERQHILYGLALAVSSATPMSSDMMRRV